MNSSRCKTFFHQHPLPFCLTKIHGQHSNVPPPPPPFSLAYIQMIIYTLDVERGET
jgi:hypothetical protein